MNSIWLLVVQKLWQQWTLTNVGYNRLPLFRESNYRTVYYNESKEIIEDSNWTTLEAAEDYIAKVTK